jgi:hypothetical protein
MVSQRHDASKWQHPHRRRVTGSTTPPSPSIELLPVTGAKPVYLDFLDRTDPNNLYPFLAVLPSSGILIVYYNEARILDEVTFETVRYLPNLPGAANDFEAGRNYPLEGTMVLLPQKTPYVENLGVLICWGGGNQGVGILWQLCEFGTRGRGAGLGY